LADFQSKMKQAAQMVATLSPEKKIEWATMHRQRGNTLFQKGNYKEAMDVYLTCLVAIGNKDDYSGGTDTDTTTISNNSVVMEDVVPSTNSTTTPTTTTVSCNEGKGDDSNKKSNGGHKTTDENEDQNESWNIRTDVEIKLPILLNLSACTLKLGMYQKTEKFCNFAIMEMPCGRTSTKAYFRRGRARMLMGSYRGAKDDFDIALELLSSTKTQDGTDIVDNKNDTKEREAEINAVKNEIVKLGRLIEAGQKNRIKCKRAMKKVLGGGGSYDEIDENITRVQRDTSSSTASESVMMQHDSDPTVGAHMPSLESNLAEVCGQHSAGLYDDVTKRRAYSTLRARPKGKKKNQDQTIVPEEEGSYVFWYISMMERSLRKILYWLGDKDAMTRSFEELDAELLEFTNEKKRS